METVSRMERKLLVLGAAFFSPVKRAAMIGCTSPKPSVRELGF